MTKKFARGRTLAAKQRKYLVVGDVHGCLEELMELLDKYRENRHIVFVGDLVDKGWYSRSCLQLAKALRATTILKGNHEDNHCRYYRHELCREETGKKNPMKRSREFKEIHDLIRKSPMDLFEFMENFPDYVRLEKAGPWNPIERRHRDVLVVHGGLLPGYHPEEMDAKKICRVRNVKPDGSFASLNDVKKDPSLPFWTDFYTGEEMVVYGHSPVKQPRVDNLTLGIDTGCVFGNTLTGLLLPELETVSVKARTQYAARRYT